MFKYGCKLLTKDDIQMDFNLVKLETCCIIFTSSVFVFVSISLFLSPLSSDGHHLPLRWGFHGDHIPFWADCLQGIRVNHVLQEQRVLLGGEGGWGLAQDNNLSARSLEQEVTQLFLCRVDHQYTIHLHQPTRGKNKETINTF